MKYRVTLETVLIIVEHATSPICCWPPPFGSSTLVILRHNLCLCIAMVHLISISAASLFTMYEYRHDFGKIIKVASELTAITSAIAKMIICKIEAPRMQVLIATMTTFLKESTREEKEFLQGYVDKPLLPHIIVFVSAVLGPVIFIAAPLLTSQPFPGDVIYPFQIESYWVYASLYISQSIGIIQVGCMVILDVLFAILLWYTGARFQMLSLELEKATNADEVTSCARKHQELIGYTDELKITMRIIATAVTAIAMLSVTAGGFILIGNPPLYEMAKYVFFELAAALELFLFTWPADNLIAASEKVGDAAYGCDWIGKSPEMLKNLIIVIQRSRSPIIISVNGFLPVLSLEFYGSIMAATFSYLTTLRAMAES